MIITKVNTTLMFVLFDAYFFISYLFHNLQNTVTDLRLPNKKPTNGQKCFSSYRGAKLWNNLTAESKQTSTLSKIKYSLSQ